MEIHELLNEKVIHTIWAVVLIEFVLAYTFENKFLFFCCKKNIFN